MERINDLLVKLDNKVSPSLFKKLNGLKSLQTRIEAAEKEYEAEPTEENKDSLEQIKDYFEDVQENVADDLEDLLYDRNSQKQTQKEDEVLEGAVIEKEDDKKESSFGILGALGILAAVGVGVITLGKLNLLGKK